MTTKEMVIDSYHSSKMTMIVTILGIMAIALFDLI